MSTAHGKLIISGEHTAVFGEPAVVTQISMGVSVDISENGEISDFLENILSIFFKHTGIPQDHSHRFIIESELPIGSGLGSSAAVAYACFQALSQYYNVVISQETYIELVQQSEQYMHGKPSGIDTYAVVKGGLFLFRKTPSEPKTTPISTTLKMEALLLNSGKPLESTKDMIEVVAKRIEAKPQLKDTITAIGSLATMIATNFSKNIFDYTLITENQNYLQQLGISSPEADSIISEVEQLGGVAKITGAGGNTNGSGMILVFHEDKKKLKKIQEKFYNSAYTITFPME